MYRFCFRSGVSSPGVKELVRVPRWFKNVLKLSSGDGQKDEGRVSHPHRRYL